MSGSFVSPETRAPGSAAAVTPIAVAHGPARPDAQRPDAHRLRHRRCIAAVAAGPRRGSWPALLVIVGGVFDLFDGALARATGKANKLGAFMDSVFDRWGEGVVYVGVVGGSLDARLRSRPRSSAAAAMAAAFMVSYTRAKSESLGFTPGTGMANVGLAPREIRIVILTVGLLVAGLAGGVGIDDCGIGCLDGTRRGGDLALERPARPHHHPRDHHHHPADRPRHPATRQQGRAGSDAQHMEQRHERARRQRHDPRNTWAGSARAATARSASRSSAWATAPTASSRAATTTRTRSRASSSRG